MYKSLAQKRHIKKNLPEVAKSFDTIPHGNLPNYVKGSKNDPMNMLARGMQGLSRNDVEQRDK